MSEWKSTAKATKSPTLMDIAWAAGIYEGEGHSIHRRKGATTQVFVTQKDPFILYRFLQLFGGSIHVKKNKPSNVWQWSVSGTRARGFVYTMYSLLSPRRRAQFKLALGEV